MPIDGFPIIVQSPRQESAVLKWMLDNFVSRQDVTINNIGGGADLVIEVGTVMGKRSIGTPSSAAGANTGTGTLTGLAVHAGSTTVKVGAYVAKCIAAAVNSGTFELIDPAGRLMAQVVVGAAVAGPDLDFTINDGATDFAVGDTFTITVPAGDGTFVPVSATGINGEATAAAVLVQRALIAAGVNDDGNVVGNDAVVLEPALLWPSGATATQIANWEAQLLANQRIRTTSQV